MRCRQRHRWAGGILSARTESIQGKMLVGGFAGCCVDVHGRLNYHQIRGLGRV